MKSKNALLLLVICISISLAFALKLTTPIYFKIPKSWPKPHYDFSKNPLTEEGFQLGRQLFYDPIISRDSTISCASCHLQATAFAHVDHQLSHGIEGKIGERNALTIQNLAWSKDFMWDGGVNHLDVQPINPITSHDEMDESMKNVVLKLQRSPKYQQLFHEAFGDSKITGQKILKALSQFMLQLTSANSKYDRVMRKEETYNEREQRGYELFKTHCASCHKEPLFTSDKFEYNGLPIDETLNDFGRMKITHKKEDSLRFKVPTLRNIQFSFPYMHDGRFNKLADVVKHYATLTPNKLLPKELNKSMNLSDKDRVDLVLFMTTLTDNEFLFNPKFGFPKK